MTAYNIKYRRAAKIILNQVFRGALLMADSEIFACICNRNCTEGLPMNNVKTQMIFFFDHYY